MGKPTGFKEFDRAVPGYADPKERVKHFEEFVQPFTDEETNQQAARCMDCGVPFCHSGCPLGNIIPEFNDAVYHEDWEYAYKLLTQTNNFPEFTGRICPAPCESSCVLGINKPPVAIEYIEKTIIETAFEKGYVKPDIPAVRTGKKVAVVGSGPAGLAAAAQLNKAGHSVTVFEREDEIGGLLRYGIPNFKLSKKIVQRRVELMESSGIQFKTNANVGVNVDAKELMYDYDAIVLAGGSTVPRDLPIPGRELNGVHFAMDFLTQQTKVVEGKTIPAADRILATDKHVVVIGGGDTGSDCIGTSNRHGAKSVMQIEIMGKPPVSRTENNPWPEWPLILRTSSSQEEGADRKWAILTKEFIGDENGNLTGLKMVDIEWEKALPGQRPNFKEIEGSERVVPAELVLLAMGFLHPQHEGMLEQMGIEFDGRGNVKDADYATNVEKIFTAGDMRRGQSLVVWAISEGRECAKKVDEFLMGHSDLESKESSLTNIAG